MQLPPWLFSYQKVWEIGFVASIFTLILNEIGPLKFDLEIKFDLLVAIRIVNSLPPSNGIQKVDRSKSVS